MLTTDKPTKPGYYWVKDPSGEEPWVVEIIPFTNEALYSLGHEELVQDLDDRKWDGPIQQPEDGGLMGGEPLFKSRCPSAAARQLATVLAHFTECELATLERYENLKSTPKSETHRHREISKKLVRHCKELGVQPRGLRGSKCPRLKDRLKEQDPQSYEE